MSQKTQRVLFWIAMLTPPWNLFWWGVAVVWVLSHMVWRDKRLASPYSGLLIVYAPYMLPWHLATYRHYRKLAEQREEQERRHIWQCTEATAFIVHELQGCGIRAVADDDQLHWSCRITAEVAPEQWTTYRRVYAEAIRRFTALSPNHICHNAAPLEPLNEEWARSIGINEYAAPHATLPCVECGKVRQFSWRWGDAAAHRPEGSEKELTINEYDGSSRKIIHAYLCEECGMKYESYSYVYHA